MTARSSWWLVYAGCAAVVLAALAWVTVTVVRLERAEVGARADASHQEALRLALWRMDSWLAPIVAGEAARPYFDYQPFYPQQRAYTTLLDPIEPGEVLTPSPLLSFSSDYFTLHFQMEPDGNLTSPQAPDGSYRLLAEQAYLPPQEISYNSQVLERAGDVLRPAVLAECVAAGEAQQAEEAVAAPGPIRAGDEAQAQQLRNAQELSKRRGTVLESMQQAAMSFPDRPEVEIEVGSLVPFWSDGTLVFARAVQVGERRYFQGFLCDWPALRAALLDQIADLFPGGRLVAVRHGASGGETGTLLATLPVALEVGPFAAPAIGLVTPVRATLGLAWLAVAAGLAAAAVTLRSTIAFGERRSRFASAVTHELRTPLTTFRMYSEMLAEGMVTDDERRRAYIETLRDESGRLSALVENVLAYARLEDGRARGRRVETTVGNVLETALPRLRQRAEAGGMELVLEDGDAGTSALSVDVDAVGQILMNLVDNACKYGDETGDRRIEISTRAGERQVEILVRDHGRGVPAREAAAIFEPFDRGARNAGDATPGVGLGLALSRGLARDMGGDLRLRLVGGKDGGACFALLLPYRNSHSSR